MALDNSWYTEQWAGQGSAISLKVAKRLHDEQSPYQRIEIFATETFGTLMTLVAGGDQGPGRPAAPWRLADDGGRNRPGRYDRSQAKDKREGENTE